MMSRRKLRLMLCMLRTLRLPRRRPWTCSKEHRMKLNRTLERVFPKFCQLKLLSKSRSNLLQAEDSWEVLLTKSNNLKMVIKMRKSKLLRKKKTLL
jgi:hypothetical protein